MKKIYVSDEHRTNPMSLQPGGSVVEVYYSSGTALSYDKIKRPDLYLREVYPKISHPDDPIDLITVDGKPHFSRHDNVDSYGLNDL
jgi:hypothetical protein